MDIPPVIQLKQTHPQPAVADVPGEVRRLWQASGLPRRIKPGMSVEEVKAVLPEVLADVRAFVRQVNDLRE